MSFWNVNVPETNFRQGLEDHDEFDEASPMKSAYCQTISEEEYEDQAISETDKALQGLIKYLEKEPETYRRLLKKRKQEEIENAGMFSYLKAKVMSTIQGDNYQGNHVSEEQCHKQLQNLTTGIKKAFVYSKECKGTRSSKRLAAKRNANQENDENSQMNSPARKRKVHSRRKSSEKSPSRNHKLASPTQGSVTFRLPSSVPPAPPPPPPVITPLGERNGRTPVRSQITKKTPVSNFRKQNERSPTTSLKSWSSASSLVSIHEELLSCTRRPLRSVNNNRNIRHQSGDSLDRSWSTEAPLQKMFLSVMQKKFRNVRTPSPGTVLNSPTSPYSPL